MGLFAQNSLDILTLSGRYADPVSYDSLLSGNAKETGSFIGLTVPVPVSDQLIIYNSLNYFYFHVENESAMSDDVADPFNLPETQRILEKMIHEKGTQVLILRQNCALASKRKMNYRMIVDSEYCQGKEGGCVRFCTHQFCCPGLVWDQDTKTARIDEVLCTGCGICEHICPAGAIRKVDLC